jgi:hypothetical protein
MMASPSKQGLSTFFGAEVLDRGLSDSEHDYARVANQLVRSQDCSIS